MSRILEEQVVTEHDKAITILIEVDESADEDGWASRGDTLKTITTDAFSKGMELVRACAEQVAATVSAVSEKARPSQVEVELAIKLSAEAGAMIAKSAGEAQLKVKLQWTRPS